MVSTLLEIMAFSGQRMTTNITTTTITTVTTISITTTTYDLTGDCPQVMKLQLSQEAISCCKSPVGNCQNILNFEDQIL